MTWRFKSVTVSFCCCCSWEPARKLLKDFSSPQTTPAKACKCLFVCTVEIIFIIFYWRTMIPLCPQWHYCPGWNLWHFTDLNHWVIPTTLCSSHHPIFCFPWPLCCPSPSHMSCFLSASIPQIILLLAKIICFFPHGCHNCSWVSTPKSLWLEPQLWVVSTLVL